MKVLITGFPGTGTSSIATKLKKCGRIAYDPQAMRGFMRLQSQQGGRPIQMPEHAPRGWFILYRALTWDTASSHQLLDCELIDNSPGRRADSLTLYRHFEASLINCGAIAVNVHANVATVVSRIITECRSI